MAASRLVRLVICGAPGSGKGTIAAWMVRDFDLKSLAAGDLLRAQIAAQTGKQVASGSVMRLRLKRLNCPPADAGKEAKQFTDKGQLVPDDLVTKLVFNELAGQFRTCNWLLDGYPRNLAQAESLTRNFALSKVIDLNVPHEEIINRIKGRLIHPQSGRVYNTDYSPPKVAGKDDETGEPLVQRDESHL